MQTSWLCVIIEVELLPIKVLHCRNRDSDDFIYELYPYFPLMYRMSENELPTSRLSKVIIWQTDRHDRNYISLRFTGGQK